MRPRSIRTCRHRGKGAAGPTGGGVGDYGPRSHSRGLVDEGEGVRGTEFRSCASPACALCWSGRVCTGRGTCAYRRMRRWCRQRAATTAYSEGGEQSERGAHATRRRQRWSACGVYVRCVRYVARTPTRGLRDARCAGAALVGWGDSLSTVRGSLASCGRLAIDGGSARSICAVKLMGVPDGASTWTPLRPT